MFGAVFLLGVILYVIYSIVKNTREDYQNRTEYRNKETNTYLAHDLIHRDLDSGKARFFYRENHDIYMRGDDIETVNISQRKRDDEYQALKKEHSPNRTTCYYSPSPQVHAYDTMLGNRYKDLQTGEILVVREFKRKGFYVGLKDQAVKRYTDCQRKFSGTNHEKRDVEEFQKEINEAKTQNYWKNKDATRVGCPSTNLNSLIDTWEN